MRLSDSAHLLPLFPWGRDAMSGMGGLQTMWRESKSSNYKPGTPGLAGTQTRDKEETGSYSRGKRYPTHTGWLRSTGHCGAQNAALINSAPHVELSLRIAFKLHFLNGGSKDADSQGSLFSSAFYQALCKSWDSLKCHLMSTRASLEREIFFIKLTTPSGVWSGFGFYEQLWLFHKVCFAFTRDGIIHKRRRNYLFQE